MTDPVCNDSSGACRTLKRRKSGVNRSRLCTEAKNGNTASTGRGTHCEQESRQWLPTRLMVVADDLRSSILVTVRFIINAIRFIIEKTQVPCISARETVAGGTR